jgi:hypothetical protein
MLMLRDAVLIMVTIMAIVLLALLVNALWG